MLAGLQHFLRGNWHCGVLLVLVFCAPGAPTAGAQTERTEAQTREELEDLRAQIEEMRERLEADRSDRSDAEARIEALDREIAELAAGIRRIEDKQGEVRGEIDRLDDRSRALARQLDAHEARVSRLAYAAYIMGRQSRLKLFLNQQDPAVINRMLGYHDYIVSARARTIERINEWVAEITALSEERRARQSELESLKAERQKEQDTLQDRRRERETALAALNDRISSRENELSRLRENEAQLEQVLRELQEFLASQRSRETAEGAFRSMKGKLRLPIAAPIAAGFGESRSTGIRWDGIMFRPESGAEVRSIFEGRVVFADWLRGFGLLLIVDHGDGFMSLYSHNESLFKQVGDWVNTEEVIATVGTSGGLDRPGLYFEIRHDGEPQNPLSWCQRA